MICVTIFDAGKEPAQGDSVAILWADRARRPERGCMVERHINKDGLGASRSARSGRRMAKTSEKVWFDLGPDDVLGVEFGTIHKNKAGARYRPQATGWIGEYEALKRCRGTSRTKEQWEQSQTFLVPNPVSSPWPGDDTLYCDPQAPLGPDDWVVARAQAETVSARSAI